MIGIVTSVVALGTGGFCFHAGLRANGLVNAELQAGERIVRAPQGDIGAHIASRMLGVGIALIDTTTKTMAIALTIIGALLLTLGAVLLSPFIGVHPVLIMGSTVGIFAVLHKITQWFRSVH